MRLLSLSLRRVAFIPKIEFNCGSIYILISNLNGVVAVSFAEQSLTRSSQARTGLSRDSVRADSITLRYIIYSRDRFSKCVCMCLCVSYRLRDNYGYMGCPRPPVRAEQSMFTIDRIVNLTSTDEMRFLDRINRILEPVSVKFRTNATLIPTPRFAKRAVRRISRRHIETLRRFLRNHIFVSLRNFEIYTYTCIYIHAYIYMQITTIYI